MSTHRNDELDRDLESLRMVTERALPTIDDTARNLTASIVRSPRPTEEGFWMKSRRILSARRGLALAGAAVVVAAVLGVVPITYERTLGHEVTLTLAPPTPNADTIARIANQLEQTLEPKEFHTTPGLQAGEVVLSAWVPSQSGAVLDRTATAFANALSAQGVPARARVTARTQRMSTNVYAMAMNRVIDLHIDRAGRTPAAIEADVRAQLEAAGVQNPQVRVTQDGDQTQVDVQADAADATGRRELKLQMKASGDQPIDQRIHSFEVERKPGMTDADIKAEVERQMREAGVEGQVTVTNGRIEIQARKEQQH